MHEVEPVKRVAGIFNAALHVNPAILAGIPVHHGRWINDLQLVRVLDHLDMITANDGDL